MDLNEVVGLDEASEITGLAKTTVQSYASTGYRGFPRHVRKMSGYRMWSKKELEQWAQNRKGATDENHC